ncbi:hypothetical protein JWE25_20290, partial [Acinetobacter baumannii]|uniref:hypothetical protein n=1 Tax=Acinetobacter baumannii TaxID=470 RepID=UPI001C0F7EE9
PLFLSVAALMTACNSGTNKESKSDSTTTVAAAPAQPAPLKDEALMREKVADFAKWKPFFDSGVDKRLAAGLHDHILGQGDEDPNTVLLVLYVDDTAKANAMSKSPELKAIRKKAGFLSMIDADYIHRVF